MATRTKRCESHVLWWWNGEYEGDCELPRGHDGPHTDGMSWWNGEGEEVEEPTKAPGDTDG